MTAFAKFAGDLGKSFLGSAAESGGSGLAGALFGGITASRQWKYQQKAMALQQKYALEQMSTQNQYNIDQFNRENAYNDPSAASARWRSAGISPMAVYGSSTGGAGVAGGSGSTPSASGPTASGPDGHAQFGPSMTLAEAAQMRNQNRLAEVQATNIEADTRNKQLDADQKMFEKTLWPIVERERKAAADKVESEAAKARVDAAYATLLNEIQLALGRGDLALKGKALDKFDAEIDNLKKDGLLKDAQAEHFKASAAYLREQATDLGATRDARIRSLDSQSERTETETEDFRNHMRTPKEAREFATAVLDRAKDEAKSAKDRAEIDRLEKEMLEAENSSDIDEDGKLKVYVRIVRRISQLTGSIGDILGGTGSALITRHGRKGK